MQIDRRKVREQFASYTRNYDPEDPKIALKIAHTYCVAENCEEIARSCDEMMETVIRQHNKYRIDENVAGKTLTFCNILRDSDKVDILRVNVETPMEEIYNVSEDELLFL